MIRNHGSIRLLLSFAWYCIRNPHQRFWQALRNWSGAYSIEYNNGLQCASQHRDTFYWTRRDGS